MGYFTDPIDDLMLGWRDFQEQHPDWFDKDHSMWVDSSDQARRSKESNMSNMSKKINAGDTLTVDDLTDDYLGAEIEVGPTSGVTYRFGIARIERRESGMVAMWTAEKGVNCAYPDAPVKVIAPPPVVQPDEPKALGQCIRIEGDDEWLAVVMSQESGEPLLDQYEMWWHWGEVLHRAGDHRIIVSDPPRWPDETPDVPERIEVGEWPDDDAHLRAWEWTDADGDAWRWYDEPNDEGEVGWAWFFKGRRRHNPFGGPWTRGERVEDKEAPGAGDVFTSIEDMPYGWLAEVTLGNGNSWGYVVRHDDDIITHRWDVAGRYGKMFTCDWEGRGTGTLSGGGVRYTLVETVEDHDARVAQDNA